MRVRVLKTLVALTVNTGDYNSVRIEQGMEIEYDDGRLTLEQAAPAHAKITEACKQAIVAQLPGLKQMSREARRG